MSCIFPMTVKMKTGELTSVNCGQCLYCRIRKRNEWIHRMESEAHNKECLFVTLTYSDFFNKKHSLNYEHLQDFIYRLRQSMKKADRPAFKYFACGEYGEKKARRHFHLALFNFSKYDEKFIRSAWFAGKIDVRPLIHNRIQYLVKYMGKQSSFQMKKACKAQNLTPPALRCSRGIGKQWLLDHMDYLKEHPYYYRNGKKYPLPSYYTRFLDQAFSFSELVNPLKRYAQANYLESTAQAACQQEISRNKRQAADDRLHGIPSDGFDVKLYSLYLPGKQKRMEDHVHTLNLVNSFEFGTQTIQKSVSIKELITQLFS